MKHAIATGMLCAFGTVACGKSGDDAVDRTESFLEALMRGVLFENGEMRDGDIPGSGGAAGVVDLAPSESVLSLVPGDASIMALDVDNPNDGNAVAATLLQFEDAESHTAVPVDGGAAAADAASGATQSLHVENPFTVVEDICERLCNQRFTTRLFFAVELEDGSVSTQGSIEIVLDCTEAGDPDRCADGAGGSGSPDAGLPDPDAGIPGGDAGPSGMLDAGGGTGSDAGPPPQIGPITPESTEAGMAVALMVAGTGFATDAVVYVDAIAVPTTFVSDVMLEAAVPASATMLAGSLAVYVENVEGDPAARSNVLYLQVAAIPGAPVIWDYSPDNGVAGDTILIIASNLAGQTLSIEEAGGTTLEAGVLGTIAWPTAGTADTVEVVLPDGVATGPITLTTSLGSYKGKIFSVGLNLTRANGTVVESSSEYNTSSWGRLSGADNLLATSFFTANGDCATDATCTTAPWYQVTFASAQTVARIAMRGNREYASGYDFIRGTFEVLDANDAVVWQGTYDLPEPDRDLDIVLPEPARGRSVRFTSLADESTEPGFAELEVFGP